jgi:hypothetical protein
MGRADVEAWARKTGQLLVVKVRCSCSGVGPEVVFHLGGGLGGVAPMGATAGVGEGAVIPGAVMADGVGLEDLAAGGDLHKGHGSRPVCRAHASTSERSQSTHRPFAMTGAGKSSYRRR